MNGAGARAPVARRRDIRLAAVMALVMAAALLVARAGVGGGPAVPIVLE